MSPRADYVLIVEDDDIYGESLARVLEHRGYDARVVGSVEAALAAARERRPGGIVLDVHLGSGSGWDVVAALRADAATAGCPIIACTGDAPQTHAHLPEFRELEAYVGKPCDPDYLLAVLAGAMGGGGIAARARRDARPSDDEMR